MASGQHRRHSRSTRRIRDPPGCMSSELYRRERRSCEGHHRCRHPSQRGVLPSAAKKLVSSFRGAREQQERQHDCCDVDCDATLRTVGCTSDDSSLSGAEECKDRSEDKGHIATAGEYGPDGGPVATAEYGPYVVEDEDGYDTDNAVVCDTVSFSATNKQTCDQPLDKKMQENVQQIVEQILLEVTIARNAWNEVAVEYHNRVESFTSLFVPHLLDSKCLTSSIDKEYHHLKGMSVLDVAAGTGAGALYAASRGASSVVATDFSENMLHVLQSRIDAGNINQMETCLANGLCLPLSWSNSYDVVLSNFGVIYFPKIEEGLSEMVRCAKPGGKVCISGWGSKEETHAFSVFPAAITLCGFNQKWRSAQKGAWKQLLAATGQQRRRQRRGNSLAPNYFCPSARMSSSRHSLHSMLVTAGLDDVQVVLVEKELRLDGVDSYWDRFVLASPNLKRFVEHCLRPEEVQRLKETVSELLHRESPNPQQGDGEGVVLKASAYIAVGTKTDE